MFFGLINAMVFFQVFLSVGPSIDLCGTLAFIGLLSIFYLEFRGLYSLRNYTI